MSIAQDVRSLVGRLAPASICDSCIAERLGLEGGDAVPLATAELAGSSGFERHKACCSLCGAEKPVIRKA